MRPPAPCAPELTTALTLPPVPLVEESDARTTVPLRPTVLVPVRTVRPELVPPVPAFEVETLNEPLEDVENPVDTDTEPPTPLPLSPDVITTRPESPSLPAPTETLIPPATPLFELVPVASTIEPLLPDEAVPDLRANDPLTPDVPDEIVLKVKAPLLDAEDLADVTLTLPPVSVSLLPPKIWTSPP